MLLEAVDTEVERDGEVGADAVGRGNEMGDVLAVGQDDVRDVTLWIYARRRSVGYGWASARFEVCN